MSIQRLDLKEPTKYRGLDDYVPNELKDFTLELIRRLSQNTDSLTNDIRNQVLVDTSILPDLTSGNASSSSLTVATSSNIDDSVKTAMMMDG